MRSDAFVCVLLSICWCGANAWHYSAKGTMFKSSGTNNYKISRGQKYSFCTIMLNSVENKGARFLSVLLSQIVPPNLRKKFEKIAQTDEVQEDTRGFCNRDIEVRTLRTVFNGPPRFTVMVGPPSTGWQLNFLNRDMDIAEQRLFRWPTGKTRLMNRVITLKRADCTPEFHALNINMRGVTLETGSVFWEHIARKSKLASASDKAWTLFADTLSNINSLKIATSGLEPFSERSKISYTYSYDSLVQAVPTWDKSSDTPFVMVIDEANALKQLAKKDHSVSSQPCIA